MFAEESRIVMKTYPGGGPSFFTPLQQALLRYLTEEQVQDIYQAFLLAQKAHEGQKRRSGKAYITHPIAVAMILCEMRMDRESIMAALLHDVIEDTTVDKLTLAARFGQEVAELVDGVSKLTQISFDSVEEAQAENFRKMVLAMAKDVRVILVKLADRLHNMRTIQALPLYKRRRIALETLEIYAPIANRLGMNDFCLEFEDLGFSTLYPMRHRVLQNAVCQARGNRKEIMSVIESTLKNRLNQNNMPSCKVWGREKHLYSIYKKMRNKGTLFSNIMDVYAFRILVDTVDSCYRVLGIIHALYKPVPARFKDYIAIPKANGYQSLHTTLFGPYGVPIEIQIRTEEMQQTAQSGIAAHWLYKSDSGLSSEAQLRTQEWLKGLVDMQKTTDSLEFIENVKIDLFPDEVYVFTPKGKILELPAGACVIDFAYAIHTDVGNACVAAKVDRRLAPLSTRLSNGQNVEVITSPNARPNPAWLNFVVTGRARSKIRHYLRHQQRHESVILGQRLLNRALSTLDLTLDDITPEAMTRVLEESAFAQLDDLLEATGLGHQVPLVVARRLACQFQAEHETEAAEKRVATQALSHKPLLIHGTEGMVVSFGECCRPIPGDPIVGIFEAGIGIMAHRENCTKVNAVRPDSEKWIYLSWEEGVSGDFLVDLTAEVRNERGVLATIAVVIADEGSNISRVDVREQDGGYSTVCLTLNIKNRRQLAKVLRRLKGLSQVNRVIRGKG